MNVVLQILARGVLDHDHGHVTCFSGTRALEHVGMHVRNVVVRVFGMCAVRRHECVLHNAPCSCVSPLEITPALYGGSDYK